MQPLRRRALASHSRTRDGRVPTGRWFTRRPSRDQIGGGCRRADALPLGFTHRHDRQL